MALVMITMVIVMMIAMTIYGDSNGGDDNCIVMMG